MPKKTAKKVTKKIQKKVASAKKIIKKTPEKPAKKKLIVDKKAAKNKKKVMLRSEKKDRSISEGPFGIKPYKPKKNEEYMNKQQVEHFSYVLNVWKEQLLDDISGTVQHMQDDAANFPDMIDRASQEEGFTLELRTRDRERKLVGKISETLDRMQDGSYGYCLDCGEKIGIKRLEARPTATQCIECKTIAEIREKQISG